MAKSKSTARIRRGDPEFERAYLLNMGLVRPAEPVMAEVDQLREVVSCCEFLLPVAQASAQPGNAPALVADWLKALAATAKRRIANGGMGAVAPMGTEVVASELNSSRK